MLKLLVSMIDKGDSMNKLLRGSIFNFRVNKYLFSCTLIAWCQYEP